MGTESKHFQMAVARLALLPYFPHGEMAAAVVMTELGRFVDRPERLRWLVDTAMARMTKWEGIAQLRALYATRWKPRDGVEGVPCAIPGFTPDDCERLHIEKAAEMNSKQLMAGDGPRLKELRDGKV